MEAHHHFNDGTWVRTPERLPVINPSDGQVIGSIARGQEAEIDAGIRAAQQALSGPCIAFIDISCELYWFAGDWETDTESGGRQHNSGNTGIGRKISPSCICRRQLGPCC
jgi:hypothetical protein